MVGVPRHRHSIRCGGVTHFDERIRHPLPIGAVIIGTRPACQRMQTGGQPLPRRLMHVALEPRRDPIVTQRHEPPPIRSPRPHLGLISIRLLRQPLRLPTYLRHIAVPRRRKQSPFDAITVIIHPTGATTTSSRTPPVTVARSRSPTITVARSRRPIVTAAGTRTSTAPCLRAPGIVVADVVGVVAAGNRAGTTHYRGRVLL